MLNEKLRRGIISLENRNEYKWEKVGERQLENERKNE